MPKRVEFAYSVVTLLGAVGANVVAWLQGPGVGATVAGLTVVAFGLISIYSQAYKRRAKLRDETWADRQRLERREREAAADAELLQRTKALKVELRLKALREKAEAKSLAARNAQLESRVADLEHALHEAQVESAKHEQREADLSRMLHEAQDTAAALASEVRTVRGEVRGVQGQVQAVQVKTEDNARKIDELKSEHSGPMPVVKDDKVGDG